jgi:hypothetical protein
MNLRLGVLAYACNPCYWEGRVGRIEVQDQLVVKPTLCVETHKLAWLVVHTYNPIYMGDVGSRIAAKAVLGKKCKTLFEKYLHKGVGGMVQVVEHLPRRHKALNLNLVISKKEKKKMNVIPHLSQSCFFRGKMEVETTGLDHCF